MSCGGAPRSGDYQFFGQPDLLAYAGELRAKNNKRDLLDLASKVHARAENYCWASEDMPIQAPTAKMSTGALYDNVANVCQQTLAKGVRKSAAQPVKYASTLSSKKRASGKKSARSRATRYSDDGDDDDDELNSADLVEDYKQQLRSMFGSSADAATNDDDSVPNHVVPNHVVPNHVDEEDNEIDFGEVDYDVEPMDLAATQRGGGVRTRTVVVPKAQRDVMAANIIKAVKYRAQPYSSEVRKAKAKQIDWDMDVNRRYVSVVRRNNAQYSSNGKHHVPSETHYVYHTPDTADFRALVSSVHKERDRLLQTSKRNYANGQADVVSSGETTAVQTAQHRVDMAQVPSFWLTTLMPRLGFKKESESPSGQVTFRRGQMTIVTEPCPDNRSNVCNAIINGIDAKKLATQLMSMIEKAGGLRGILSKLPIGGGGGAGNALGRLGQLGSLLG